MSHVFRPAQWTAGHGACRRALIALVNTAIESRWQIAMIPMLAWIANSAPAHLKATYFA